MSLAEIKQQASQLNLEERLELQEFLSSLEAESTLSPAWQSEIAARLESVRSGQVQPLTHEEFWRRIRASRA